MKSRVILDASPLVAPIDVLGFYRPQRRQLTEFAVN